MAQQTRIFRTMGERMNNSRMRNRMTIFFLFLLLVIGLTGLLARNVPAAQETVGELPPAPPPYTGIINNKTGYDLSIPSLNSQAAVVVPACSWIEYTAWSPRFQVVAYADGKPVYCQDVTVQAQKYQFKCRSYDFVAEIYPSKPAPQPAPKKKSQPKRKKGDVSTG